MLEKSRTPSISFSVFGIPWIRPPSSYIDFILRIRATRKCLLDKSSRSSEICSRNFVWPSALSFFFHPSSLRKVLTPRNDVSMRKLTTHHSLFLPLARWRLLLPLLGQRSLKPVALVIYQVSHLVVMMLYSLIRLVCRLSRNRISKKCVYKLRILGWLFPVATLDVVIVKRLLIVSG